jgi:hypothetical protein
MKIKNLLLVVLLVFVIGQTFAQKFEKGDWDVNAGLGFGYTYDMYTGVNSWPTLYGSVEKGIVNISDFGVISAGGLIAYKHMSYDDYGYDWSWSDLYIGGRGAFHFSKVKVDNLDLYAGVSLGLRFYTNIDYSYADDNYEKVTHSAGFSGAFAGAKYYLKDNIAAFGELGYDVSWIKLGVTFKL